MDLHVSDLHAHGVRLIPPTDPNFDSLARPLIGERVADLVLKLKPMLVIVSNDSGQTIASLSTVWTVRYLDGRTSRHWTHASFPWAISGLDPRDSEDCGIRSGGQRIEGKGIVVHGYGRLDPYYDQFLEQWDPRRRDGLNRARELHIEVNAVIFKDGRLAGPDDGAQLQDLFSRYVNAQQTWLRGIREALDSGQTVASAFGAVERFQREQAESRGAPSLHREDPDHLWRVQTSADLMGWRDRHNGTEIATLVRGFNLEPFVIRTIE